MKIIPIFIPHAGCSYRCIYCDQHKISGADKLPSTEEIKSSIERNLGTISRNERTELAFFGGTFTLMPESLQQRYLEAVYPYVKSKKIQGLRMSTHPEAISEKSMKLFKKMGGCLVELGVQSLDAEVLKKSRRAMDFKIIRNASRIIKKSGLDLGVQVMLGLPGDTLEKSIRTAEKLIELEPKTARIYPAIVLKGTGLGDLFKKGRYKPLSLEDAIEWSACVSDIFEKGAVKVIRIGLHPSECLNSKKIILAGPYHASFGEMARARQMRNRIRDILGAKKIPNRKIIEIRAPKNMFNLISGHRGLEKKYLEKYYGAPVHLRGEPSGSPRRWTMVRVKDIRKSIAIIDPRMPSKAKIRLKKMGYYITEAPMHPKLAKPVRGHPDMMLFSYGKKIIYEPHLEKIAGLLKDNGYECIKGEYIKSSAYPADIIYDACSLGKSIIRYDGKIEKHIERLSAKFIKVKQGYAKCSIAPVDGESIITSDKSINDVWGKNSLLVTPGHIKLPGYDTGFIGGASGVHKDKVFFTGVLKSHPDGYAIRDFIKKRDKKAVELCDGMLRDVGSILFFDQYPTP
ncbi:MAG: radical SAM protein [Candidatus Omnitrophota bacterium]|nr:radical SAM protein [Candidatus Omnitrophota bacterium]